MRKKYFGYGEFFCWHCGRRQVVGRYKCPYCGASYNNPAKSKVKYTVNPKSALGNLHPSVIRAQFLYILWCLIFGAAWSLIVMRWLSNVTDIRVYLLIWGFWIIWIIGHTLMKAAHVTKSRAKNLTGPTVVCGYCDQQMHRHANYCDDCGCVILKPSTEGDLTVDPDMSTVGISPTHTKSGKRRKKKKISWGMVIFWTLFIGLACWGMYVSSH